MTKGGELVVVCQDHRSQLRNLETAVERLEQLLREASEVPRGPSQLTLSRIRALSVLHYYTHTHTPHSHAHTHVHMDGVPGRRWPSIGEELRRSIIHRRSKIA